MESTTNKKKPLIICNVGDTEYEVVKHVAQKKMFWQLSEDFSSDEWDIEWTDNAVAPDKLTKMRPYQKINHFPGMYGICKKNYLAWNLNRMSKLFPGSYNFHPKTWVLPGDWIDFKNNFAKNKTFILKPEASCQGRGIFLVKKIEDVNPNERYVAQEYLKEPLLIDGLKFDLRVYVLVTGCSPLRVYIHELGLARLATEPFSLPTYSNLNDMCMHLTNYAINKNSSKFVFNEDCENDDIGHKRSLNAIWGYLEAEGADVKSLKTEIEEIIMKTLCAVQPYLSHLYKSSQPDELSNSMCFELLGFDIIIDSSFKPWVLEVNHSPSFSTDSPLDWKIKKKLIKDSMTMLNVRSKTRKKYFSEKKQEVLKRAITGKISKESKEERIEIAKGFQAGRDKWENSHLGGFKKLYPRDDDIFEKFIQGANSIYTELTGTNISRVKKKEELKPYSPPKTAKFVRKSAEPKREALENIKADQTWKQGFISFVERQERLAQESAHEHQSLVARIQESIRSKYPKERPFEIPPLHVESIKLAKIPIKLNDSSLPGNFLPSKLFEFSPRIRHLSLQSKEKKLQKNKFNLYANYN